MKNKGRNILKNSYQMILIIVVFMMALYSISLFMHQKGVKIDLGILLLFVAVILLMIVYYTCCKAVNQQRHLQQQLQQVSIYDEKDGQRQLCFYEDSYLLIFDFRFMFPPFHQYDVVELEKTIDYFEVILHLTIDCYHPIIIKQGLRILVLFKHTTSATVKSVENRLKELVEQANQSVNKIPLRYETETLHGKKAISKILVFPTEKGD